MNVPVVFIVFNRPGLTRLVFEKIRACAPKQLFVVADGPRTSCYREDLKLVREVRNIVADVDWRCEVGHKYSDSNLGIKKNVVEGLDWVFGQVDRAIVLEDDCLAHSDFFHFCDVLLEQYANDERISVISGVNFQNGRKRGNGSYYFSKYNHCWGWATWRRAWLNNHADLPFWPEWSRSADWREKCPDPVERSYWSKIFDRVRDGDIDSWAYSWTASVWYSGGLTVTPNVNLVSNIGFGHDATHTVSLDSDLAGMMTYEIGELVHPSFLVQDQAADRYVFDNTFNGKYRRFPLVFLYIARRVGGFFYRELKRIMVK